jgi:O-antigen/teichoic acid export membrane protein
LPTVALPVNQTVNPRPSGKTGPHGFWRSVTLVLTGTAMAQAIPIIGSLAISRLFLPDAFGHYMAWLGIVMVAAVLVTGRLEMALAIEADGEPRRFGVLGTLLAIALGTTCLLPLVLVAWLLAPRGWIPGSLLALFVPAVAGFAVTQTWQLWAAAEGRFRSLAALRITQAAGVTVLQITAGWLAPAPFTLALAHVAGLAIAFLVAIRLLPLDLPRLPRAELLARARDFWSRNRRFLVYSLPGDGINTAATNLPVVIVGARFGGEVAGLLGLAIRSLGAPISLLGSSVLDVFRRHAAHSWRERGECRADFVQTFFVLAAGATLVAVAIGFFSEDLFAWVFGERWRGAGTIALWMMPMFAMRFVASPLSYVFYVAGRQNVDLIWQAALLAMTLGTLTVSAHYEAALQAYSAGYTLLYVAYLMLSYRFSGGAGR